MKFILFLTLNYSNEVVLLIMGWTRPTDNHMIIIGG
jgi:hypothetical protein